MGRLWLNCVLNLLFACALFATPATSPSPSTDQAVEDAKAALVKAKDSCQKKLDADKNYQALSADVLTKKQALRDPRDSGTTQQKLDAGSAYNIARMLLDATKKKALDSDPGIIAATKVLDVAEKNRDQENKLAADRLQQANAAKQKEEAAKKKAEEEKNFDAEFVHGDISAWQGLLQQARLIRARYIDDNLDVPKDVDAQIADLQKELSASSAKYAAWENSLPKPEDVPALLNGKTIDEAQKAMKTKIHSTTITGESTTYHLETLHYSITFSIPSGKTISDVEVTNN